MVGTGVVGREGARGGGWWWGERGGAGVEVVGEGAWASVWVCVVGVFGYWVLRIGAGARV